MLLRGLDLKSHAKGIAAEHTCSRSEAPARASLPSVAPIRLGVAVHIQGGLPTQLADPIRIFPGKTLTGTSSHLLLQFSRQSLNLNLVTQINHPRP